MMATMFARRAAPAALFAVATTLALPVAAEPNKFKAELTGYSETPSTLWSDATGTLKATYDKKMQTLSYELSYDGFASTVTQAHIHFGAAGLTGGVSVFLCSNLGNGPAGTPACPANGTVSGTLTAAEVVGPAAQGIAPGQLDRLLEAMREGAAYANVHSTTYPGGEIRGQIKK